MCFRKISPKQCCSLRRPAPRSRPAISSMWTAASWPPIPANLVTVMVGRSQALLWERFTHKAQAIGATVHMVADEIDASELVLAAAPHAAYTGGLAGRFPSVAERLRQGGAVARE